MQKKAATLLILLFALVTIPLIPTSPLHVSASTGPTIVQSATSLQPLNFTNGSNYVQVGNMQFYKATAGYDEIYMANGSVLVYNEQITLQYQTSNGNWKQIGTPQSISWTNSSDYSYNVTRFYSNSLGTTYNITYSLNSGQPVKISITLQSGQASTFQVNWALSGITYQSYALSGNSLVFSYQSNNLTVGWQDVATSFGNITTSAVTTGSQGRDADIYFGIGALSSGQRITIDPTLAQSGSGSATTSVAVAFGSAVTSGDMLIVGATVYDTTTGSTPSISDSLTDSFTLAASQTTSCANSCYEYIYYTTAKSSGSDTITFSAGTSSATLTESIMEVSGITSTGMQTSQGSATSGTTLSVTSYTPATNSFVFAQAIIGSGSAPSCTAGTGYSLIMSGGFAKSCSEYLTSSSGSTTSQFTASASVNWLEISTSFPPAVTQPINIPTPPGASAFTYTVTPASGCTVSPTSGISGSATDFTATPSCVLTETMPSAGSNTRETFASSSQTTAVTTCSSGTCPTFNPSDYYQIKEQFAYSILDGGTGYSAPILSFAAAGVASTYTETTTLTAVWMDQNVSWSTTNPLTGSGSSQRWVANSLTSGTPTAGSSITTPYYHQDNLTLSYAVKDGGTPTAPTATGLANGSSYAPTLTTTPKTYFFDDNGSVAISTSTGGTGERWAPDPSSVATSSANSVVIDMYHQYSLSYSYSVSGGGTPTAPTLAYTEYGGGKTLLLTSATQSTWGDAGDAVGWTNPLSPSTSSERWATPDANISSLAAGQSSVLTYYHQYPLYLNTSQIKATATVNGTSGTSLSNGTWVDKGSNIYTTGIASFTFPSLSEKGYLYQEPSKGFQVLSNVSISSLTFSSSNNQLQWIASAVSTSQTGIIQGYTISQASSNYTLSQGIATMNQAQTTNYFIFTTGGGGGGGGGTGGGGGGYVSPTSTTTVTQSQSQSQTQTQTQVQTGNQTLYYVGAGGIIFILILVFAPLSLRRKDKGIRHENHKPPKGIRHENKKPNKGIRDKH